MCTSCDKFVAARRSTRKPRLLPLPKGATFAGQSKRPLAKVYAEAVADAKAAGWPGSYDLAGTVKVEVTA